MGHTLLCVLELFLLNTLLYIHAEANTPKAELSADDRDIPVRGSVTLTCSVKTSSSGWNYTYIRGENPNTSNNYSISTGQISVSQEGVYWCRGRRENTNSSKEYTEYSDSIRINKNVVNKAAVTLQPNWSKIFSGETITLRCEIKNGGDTEWEYEWKTTSSRKPSNQKQVSIRSASVSHSGDYRCKGRMKNKQSTDWSDPIKLTVSSNRPKAELRADDRDIPEGGSVTLTCSVKTSSSSSWKYFWYRGEKTSEPLTTQDVVFISTGRISVSQEGVYWCRGGRGKPVYYTEYSDSISINKNVVNKAVVTPNWSKIFSGETITLRCEIKNGGDTEWEYEWKTNSSRKPSNQNEVSIRSASVSHSGDYRCKGRMKNNQSTDWSDPIKLTVSDEKPKSVLTVSPLWLNAGDSVTLNCEVEHPSAGWRFYWYKTVPKLPGNSYSFELLPGSSNGTEQDSYIVHGQTHTARYVCRAGRGDPVYYTEYSEPQLVWSGAVSRPESSSFYVGLIVGLVCGIVLLLLLYLLYRCRPSNNSCCIRQSQSESTNQGSDTNHVDNQNEAQGGVYSTPLHGDACVYETIKGSEDTENDEYENVASSSIELKKVG